MHKPILDSDNNRETVKLPNYEIAKVKNYKNYETAQSVPNIYSSLTGKLFETCSYEENSH